jgi:transcriptional regulator with XRE-family HTH domain
MTAEAAYLAQIGVWLRDQRIAAGLNKAELARATGISDSSLADWEAGKKEMGVVAHARLRAFFKARAAAAPARKAGHA